MGMDEIKDLLQKVLQGIEGNNKLLQEFIDTIKGAQNKQKEQAQKANEKVRELIRKINIADSPLTSMLTDTLKAFEGEENHGH